MKIDVNKVISKLDLDGICVLPDFLSLNEMTAIANEGHTLFGDDQPFARKHADPGGASGSFLLNLIPERITRHKGWDQIKSFERIISHGLISRVADNYLGPGWGTTAIIYNYTKGPSSDERFPLHFDVADGYKMLKAYLYLNTGGLENGAFRYIPGSHRLVRAALPKLFKPGTTKVESNNLEDLLEVIRKFPSLINDPDMARTHELLVSLANGTENTYDYVVSGEAGTLVLFDTVGIHGGGKVFSGDRYIARYHFVEPSFVFRNLPEQLHPLKRIFSHAWRISRKFVK